MKACMESEKYNAKNKIKKNGRERFSLFFFFTLFRDNKDVLKNYGETG